MERFTLNGQPAGSFPLPEPRGAARLSGEGVWVASPAAGVAAVGEDLLSLQVLEGIEPPDRPAAALDVAADDDRIAILDAAGPSLVLLFGRSDFERRLGLDLPGARAVLPSRRREAAAVFVADGATVREIGLPEPSPLPTVLALRDRLAAGDVAGALALVHPSRRAVFERIYADIAADLPIEAEFMRSFRVDLVREDRAIVVIESEVPVQGSLVREDFPMLLVRGRGGQWMVLEY